MFLGSTFAGCPETSYGSAEAEGTITSLTLKSMVLDEIYATKQVLVKFDWDIPTDWNFDTHLHALYKNDVYAGNVSYSESVVQKVKIKKRFKGDFTWKTIYEKEIHTNEDFAIEIWDYLEPSHRDIEYAYVAVIANADMDTISTEVYSEFDSYFIVGQDEIYPAIIDAETVPQLNRESKTIVSPGSKYPYVVTNGISKYYSGTFTATFIELKECDFDVDNGWTYRNKIDEFLTDGRAKIIKTYEGDMWMVNIVGSIPRTVNDHYQNVSQQFDWVECGDPTKIGDLYDNGFIDTDIDRE